MKAHKQATRNSSDSRLSSLPWDRQKAIMEFFLYGSAKMYEDTLREMSDVERSFLYALTGLIDAFGSAPDERYRELLKLSSELMSSDAGSAGDHRPLVGEKLRRSRMMSAGAECSRA
jgi:hypothetical protein